MAAGSRSARVCICEDHMRESLELHFPQLLCPVRQLWPAIRRRAAAGGPLFPGLSRGEGAGGAEGCRCGAELATR